MLTLMRNPNRDARVPRDTFLVAGRWISYDHLVGDSNFIFFVKIYTHVIVPYTVVTYT